MASKLIKEEQLLFDEIKHLIESSRQKVLVKVNSELILLYWSVGTKLNTHVLGKSKGRLWERSCKEIV